MAQSRRTRALRRARSGMRARLRPEPKGLEAYDLSPWQWTADNRPPRLEPYIEDGEWDGVRYQLVNTFTLGCRTIQAAFITDGVSRPLGLLIRRMGVFLCAGIVHDADYHEQSCTQREADDRFWRNAIRTGAPRWKANLAWAGLRVGGWVAWRAHAKRIADSLGPASG